MNTGSEATVFSDTIVRLLRRNATKNLGRIVEGMRPADLAAVFRFVPGNKWKQLFDLVAPLDRAAEVLTELDTEILQVFLEQFSDVELAMLLAEMSSDDAADILEELSEERAAAITAATPHRDDLSEAIDLLQYDPETAGGLMVPDVFALPASLTAGAAISELQRSSDELEMVFYLYVVNEHDHLVGVCSLRDLVIVPPEIQLADVMTPDVVRVTTQTDQEEVARIVARYNLLAVPVVDDNNKLVGLVTVDDIIDVIRLEATEDMMKMAGVSNISVAERATVMQGAKSRIPWLFASFVGGVLAALVISSFEAELKRIAALAAFIPIIVGMGGNVGTQSSTIVTRGIALGQIDFARLWSVVRREVGIGLTCGALYGLLLGLITMALYNSSPDIPSPLNLAFVVATSVASVMVIAALVGGAVPLLFQRLNIDPAIATGPFVTTAVDVIGILAYFTVAKLMLPF